MFKPAQLLTSSALLTSNILISLIICLLVIITLSPQANAAEIKRLKICWESELKPPYLTLKNNGELKGIAVEWLQQIMELQNLDYQNVILPWKRCLLNLERGSVDIVPNSSYKESRTKFSFYSQELYRTHLAFFYRKEKLPNAHSLTSIEQFKPYVIGGVRGFNYSFYDGLLSLDKGASNRKALVRKLKRGRVDFAILQREVIASIYQNQQHELKDLKSLPAPNNSYKSFYVLIGKAHTQAKQITHQLDTGLDKLHKSGGYQRTLDRYLK